MSPDKNDLDPKNNPSYSPELTEIENRPLGFINSEGQPTAVSDSNQPAEPATQTTPNPEAASSEPASPQAFGSAAFAPSSTQPAFSTKQPSRFSKKAIIIAAATTDK